MNKVQKQYAISLADKIENGVLSVSDVYDIFESNKDVAVQITKFWLNFTPRTQKVLHKVVTEGYRRHLEKCFNLTMTDDAD